MTSIYDIFISYSRKDAQIVNDVVSKLEEQGFRIWIDKKGIASGDAFKRIIVKAIEGSTCVLFFSSADSNRSTWIEKEIGVAVYENKTIIPILIDKSKYNPDLKFDLINLDYLDYTEPELRPEMLARLIYTLHAKCSKYNDENGIDVVCHTKADNDMERSYTRDTYYKNEGQTNTSKSSSADQWRKAKEEAKRKAEEDLRKQREERLRKEAEEARLKAEEDARRKAEEEKKRAEEARRRAEEAKQKEEERQKREALERMELFRFNNDGVYGFAGKSGKVVIPCQWKLADEFSEGLAAVKDANGKWGYIDKTGTIVIKCQWELANNFSEGLALVGNTQGMCGYINNVGETIIPFNWKWGHSFYEGVAAVRNLDNKWGFINNLGIIVIPCQWEKAGDFSNGLATVTDSNNQQWKIDKHGKIIRGYKLDDGERRYTNDTNYKNEGQTNTSKSSNAGQWRKAKEEAKRKAEEDLRKQREERLRNNVKVKWHLSKENVALLRKIILYSICYSVLVLGFILAIDVAIRTENIWLLFGSIIVVWTCFSYLNDKIRSKKRPKE